MKLRFVTMLTATLVSVVSLAGASSVTCRTGVACTPTGITEQGIFTLNFDENGNGTLDGSVPDPGILLLDPQSGLTALAYALPVNVGGGDVGVIDGGGMLSDGLRFEDIGGVSYLFFFSLADGDSIADTGIPSGGFAGFTVTENPDGSFAFYSGGAPGVNNDYLGQSTPDAPPIPEPSSLLLLGTGLVGIAGAARRRFLS